MNTSNLALDLPGMPYDGVDRDSFISRDAMVNAELIAAPIHTVVDMTRLTSSPNGGFNLETSLGNLRSRNVVLAMGAYQVPQVPALAAKLPARVTQLHAHDYRSPSQLPAGGSAHRRHWPIGWSDRRGTARRGREVHLSVSIVPQAPRRHRGQDLIYWMLETGKHGPASASTPSPPRCFPPLPNTSPGIDGGHSIHLRELGRSGIHLHGT